MDSERIKIQAKQLLDDFANALADVEKETKEEESVDRPEFERKEENGKESDSEFRAAFLKNSPSHNEDFIIAEKGDWK
jgi:hypothetical protein